MRGMKRLDHRHHDLLQQARRDVEADRAAGVGVAADRIHRLFEPIERLGDGKRLLSYGSQAGQSVRS